MAKNGSCSAAKAFWRSIFFVWRARTSFVGAEKDLIGPESLVNGLKWFFFQARWSYQTQQALKGHFWGWISSWNHELLGHSPRHQVDRRQTWGDDRKVIKSYNKAKDKGETAKFGECWSIFKGWNDSLGEKHPLTAYICALQRKLHSARTVHSTFLTMHTQCTPFITVHIWYIKRRTWKAYFFTTAVHCVLLVHCVCIVKKVLCTVCALCAFWHSRRGTFKSISPPLGE